MDWPEISQLHRGRSLREGLKLWLFWLVPWGALAFGLQLAGLNIRLLLAFFGAVAILSLAIILRFFRDFTPVLVPDVRAIVSPAHGIVDAVEFLERHPRFHSSCWRISIYLSLRDVHVQNAPVDGTLVSLQFIPGERRRAIHADAAQRNESLLLHFVGGAPAQSVFVKLIAGVFVRRIVPWIASGDTVQRGQRISLIRFGSRADVYLPANVTILVRQGDRVVGSETILAKFNPPEAVIPVPR